MLLCLSLLIILFTITLKFKRSENNEIVSSLLSRSPSGNILKQSLPTSHDLWADGIDKSLYDVIEKAEKRRQENIYELIYTEEDYVNSLEYLQTVSIKSSNFKTSCLLCSGSYIYACLISRCG